MPEAIPLPLEPGVHLVEPPIVDFLYFDSAHNSYRVTFIPDDQTSASEKEDVEIKADTHEGFRIKWQLEALARLFGCNGIDRISHLGGGEFEFHVDHGKVVTLSGATPNSFTTANAHRSLQDIATTAEIMFIVEQRKVDAVA